MYYDIEGWLNGGDCNETMVIGWTCEIESKWL